MVESGCSCFKEIMEEIKTELQLAAIEKETRSFECPCCNAKLQFRTRVHITSVQTATTPEESAARDGREVSLKQKETISESQKSVIETAKQNGTFKAFVAALEAGATHVPINKEAYFVKWLSKTARQKTPAFALRQCLEERDLEAAGELELWGFQYVSAVMVDDEFKVFIPQQLIKGDVIEKLEATPKGLKVKQTINLPIWIRTRFGYVEKSGGFSDELRKHSIGAFAKAST